MPFRRSFLIHRFRFGGELQQTAAHCCCCSICSPNRIFNDALNTFIISNGRVEFRVSHSLSLSLSLPLSFSRISRNSDKSGIFYQHDRAVFHGNRIRVQDAPLDQSREQATIEISTPAPDLAEREREFLIALAGNTFRHSSDSSKRGFFDLERLSPRAGNPSSKAARSCTMVCEERPVLSRRLIRRSQ